MESARIMIVEDELIFARSIRASLEKLGYTVTTTVSSGEEAIRQAVEDRPDLVLMDIVLKGLMDGIEAGGEIRNRTGIPVVFTTAYSEERFLRRAKTIEPFGYILKPYTDRELRVTIEIALYRRRMEAEREGLVRSLREALEQVKQLSGLLPICSSCKRIRDDQGYWSQLEAFFTTHSSTRFTHSICPECLEKFYQSLQELE